MSNSELIRDLVAIAGEPNVVHRAEDLLVFEYDGSVDRALPTVVALPRATSEVSGVVKTAAVQLTTGENLVGIRLATRDSGPHGRFLIESWRIMWIGGQEQGERWARMMGHAWNLKEQTTNNVKPLTFRQLGGYGRGKW